MRRMNLGGISFSLWDIKVSGGHFVCSAFTLFWQQHLIPWGNFPLLPYCSEEAADQSTLASSIQGPGWACDSGLNIRLFHVPGYSDWSGNSSKDWSPPLPAKRRIFLNKAFGGNYLFLLVKELKELYKYDSRTAIRDDWEDEITIQREEEMRQQETEMGMRKGYILWFWVPRSDYSGISRNSSDSLSYSKIFPQN
jgi:hypothetical protein